MPEAASREVGPGLHDDALFGVDRREHEPVANEDPNMTRVRQRPIRPGMSTRSPGEMAPYPATGVPSLI